MPDNYSMWEHHGREKEKWLESRPQCDYCQEHIQDDHYFEINGVVICLECLEDNFRKEIDDFFE